MDGMEDLLKAVEDTTPDEVEEVEEQPQTFTSSGSFSMDGMEDLLKAVEDTTPDEVEEAEEDTIQPPALDDMDSTSSIEELMKEVEGSMPSNMLEEL
jgi:hypothetical protein